MNCKKLPKIELHHHFDGAFNISQLYEEAKRRKLPQGQLAEEEFTKKCRVDSSCRSLTEFLDTFHFFYDIAQNTQFLHNAALSLPHQLKEDGVIYTETRFAPHLFQNGNDHIETVLEAVLSGFAESGQNNVAMILCVMRGSPYHYVHELVDLYTKYHEQGVVGIDLAGDESKFQCLDYAPAFAKAKDNNIPVTIHAGEAAGAESVWNAINLFNARRIGHGIRSFEDPQLIETLRDNQICLEICLTSNLQTGTCSSYKSHPFFDYFKQDLCVTINTDDPSVSAINLSHEWEKAITEFSLQTEQIQTILINSVKSAFCSLDKKIALSAVIHKFFSE